MKRSNGEGTIFKRKDGRWCGAYYDDSPAPRRHYIYGRTQTEVKKKLKAVQADPDAFRKPEKEYSLSEWVLFYLETYKINEVKKTTLDSYMGIYRKHIRDSELGKLKLNTLTSNYLQKYYNEKTAEGLNAKTVKHISIVINSALDQAVKLRLIRENVNKLITIPKKKDYKAKVLSVADVHKIIIQTKEDKLYPIVVLTICTGLRKGEVMALKWQDINFDERVLTVNGSLCRVEARMDEKGRIHHEYVIMEPKTEKSKRIVPLIDTAIEALYIQKQRQAQIKRMYKDIYQDEGLIFAKDDGSYLDQRSFMDEYHEYLKRYGISDVRFHDLRHTFASLMLEAGESPKMIQELLGHSTITTTMDIYTHITKQGKIKAVKTLDSLIENVNEQK